MPRLTPRQALTAIWCFLLAAVFCPSLVSGDEKRVVPAGYIEAQEALAADDLSKARRAMEALAKESGPDLMKLLREAAGAEDIEKMRKAFAAVSDYVVSNMELPAGHSVAHCPMFGKSGASWVQKTGEVANPYYGASMLRCGTIKQKR